MIKFIQCPVISGGEFGNRPKLFDIKIANRARPFQIIRQCIVIKPEGDPNYGQLARNYYVCIVRGADLSDIDADATCIDLLAGVDIDDNLAALRTRLKAKLLSSLSTSKRNKLKSLATACDVDTSVFTGQNTVWDVLKACFTSQGSDIDNTALDSAG